MFPLFSANKWPRIQLVNLLIAKRNRNAGAQRGEIQPFHCLQNALLFLQFRFLVSSILVDLNCFQKISHQIMVYTNVIVVERFHFSSSSSCIHVLTARTSKQFQFLFQVMVPFPIFLATCARTLMLCLSNYCLNLLKKLPQFSCSSI